MIMQPGEIARDYLAAVNKGKQIGILAELNACSKDEIRAVLRTQGVELPQPGRKPAAKTAKEERIATPVCAPARNDGDGETDCHVDLRPPCNDGSLRAAAVDAIAELLAMADGRSDQESASWEFREQVRGVLRMIHVLEREDRDEPEE